MNFVILQLPLESHRVIPNTAYRLLQIPLQNRNTERCIITRLKNICHEIVYNSSCTRCSTCSMKNRFITDYRKYISSMFAQRVIPLSYGVCPGSLAVGTVLTCVERNTVI